MGPSLSRRFRVPIYLSELPISYCETDVLTSVEQDELNKNYIQFLCIKNNDVPGTAEDVRPGKTKC